MNAQPYRPADETSIAIQTALRTATQDFAAMDSRIAAAKRERDSLLIDGEPNALKQAESQLRAARDERERLEAIVEQLTGRLAAAKRTEMLGLVDRRREELRAAYDAIATYWREHSATLTSLVANAQSLAEARQLAAQRLDADRRAAFDLYPDDGDQIAAGLADPQPEVPEAAYDWLRALAQPLVPRPETPVAVVGPPPARGLLARARGR